MLTNRKVEIPNTLGLLYFLPYQNKEIAEKSKRRLFSHEFQLDFQKKDVWISKNKIVHDYSIQTNPFKVHPSPVAGIIILH